MNFSGLILLTIINVVYSLYSRYVYFNHLFFQTHLAVASDDDVNIDVIQKLLRGTRNASKQISHLTMKHSLGFFQITQRISVISSRIHTKDALPDELFSHYKQPL